MFNKRPSQAEDRQTTRGKANGVSLGPFFFFSRTLKKWPLLQSQGHILTVFLFLLLLLLLPSDTKLDKNNRNKNQDRTKK